MSAVLQYSQSVELCQSRKRSGQNFTDAIESQISAITMLRLIFLYKLFKIP